MKRAALGVLPALLAIVAVATRSQLLPFPESLPPGDADLTAPRHVDRFGEALSVTYQNDWNVHDRLSLQEIPDVVKKAFIAAEDKRFYEHGGADWIARFHAAFQNLKALRAVRGASTITEQVVRMLHPRPRTLWSRWLEGFEAARLEAQFGKDAILELYLNQVPYAGNRRGVHQAARTYFDRDLDTLNVKEVLALAVAVRSPTRYDLHRRTEAIEAPVERLATRLFGADEARRIQGMPLQVSSARLPVDAAHFLRSLPSTQGSETIRTTLDGSLQTRAQRILDRRLAELEGRDAGDGALLVVDHETDEILAWVNAGGLEQERGGHIDMVTAPRQPGSTLKPFVYALALENGWTAATILEDEPVAEAVGHGLHPFRNYSRHYYGPLRLREALGNSLNVPAIKAIQFTGRAAFQQRLRELGVSSLKEHPDFYGDGLALGNGEISLFELVSAYAVLARGGIHRPLRGLPGTAPESRRILSGETSSLIADILSDPEARALEFGRDSVLALPRQTAVKTGTSNDYRDAWTVGFSSRYTVGVWMGNLDRRPMREVTGSIGPALVLRSIFAELHRHREAGPLYLSRTLRQVPICRESGAFAGDSCPRAMEWFRPNEAPDPACPIHGELRTRVPRYDLRLAQPSPGLHVALDPRIPDELERFELKLKQTPAGARVDWFIDEELLGTSTAENGALLWQPSRGRHTAWALVRVSENEPHQETERVVFLVK